MKRPPLSPEMRNFILITALVFIMLVVVNHYSPDDTLIAATLAIAIYTLFFATLSLKASRDSLELTEKSLELTSIDIKTRVRPFISATQILPLTADNFNAEGFSIILRNTGTIPATKLEVNVSLMNSDNAPGEGGVSTGCSLLAPSADFQVNVIKPHQQIINSAGLRVQVYTRYQGLDRSYETTQTYKIRIYPQTRGAPGNYLFGSQPIEPSSFT